MFNMSAIDTLTIYLSSYLSILLSLYISIYLCQDLEYNLEMFHVAEVEEDDEEVQEDAPLLPPPSPRSTRKFDSVRNLLEKVVTQE